MRKLIFIAAVGLLTSSVMQGQVTFGVKGGLNVSNLRTSVTLDDEDAVATHSSSIGLHAGLTAEIHAGDNFSIEPGLSYSMKGWKATTGYIDDLIGATTHLNYLEIPLNLIYKLYLNDDLKIILNAGPYAGYLLSAVGKSGSITSGNVANNYSRLDYGVNAGAGVEFQKFTLGLQYGIGLANLEKTKTFKMYNGVFGVSVGYKFKRN